MKEEKRKRLEEKGWVVSDTTHFLQLTPEEELLIALKLALSESLKNKRVRAGMTQSNLAELLGSSQSRVSKAEKGEASVSFELLLRSLLKLGTTRDELANIIKNASFA